MKKDTVLVVVSYALVYMVWGSTYFFIKAAVGTIPPSIIVAVRFLFGSLILATIAWGRGGFRSASQGLPLDAGLSNQTGTGRAPEPSRQFRLPSGKEIAGAAIIGILLLLLGNGLVTIGQQTIPSWTTSVVVACMPIYVAFYNRVLYKTKVSAICLAGALIGVAGVGLILMRGNGLGLSFGPGIFIAIAGALAWGLGTSIARSLPKPPDVLVSTSIQMLVAGSFALLIGLASGVKLSAAFASASAWSIFGLVYLTLMGALALVAYNHLLVVEPSFRVASYSLVNPLIAVTLGLATGEAASSWFFIGAPLVLAGLVAILYGDIILDRFRQGR
jgi:drug/metabolite transporter (DMT)-like permease